MLLIAGVKSGQATTRRVWNAVFGAGFTIYGLYLLLFFPGGLLLFFKTGPFAYHGLFVFWVPMIAFGLWILILSWGARRAVLHEARCTGPAGRP